MVFPGVLRGLPGPRLATTPTDRPRRSLSSPGVYFAIQSSAGPLHNRNGPPKRAVDCGRGATPGATANRVAKIAPATGLCRRPAPVRRRSAGDSNPSRRLLRPLRSAVARGTSTLHAPPAAHCSSVCHGWDAECADRTPARRPPIGRVAVVLLTDRALAARSGPGTTDRTRPSPGRVRVGSRAVRNNRPRSAQLPAHAVKKSDAERGA
jgi:hypothetical protein